MHIYKMGYSEDDSLLIDYQGLPERPPVTGRAPREFAEQGGLTRTFNSRQRDPLMQAQTIIARPGSFEQAQRERAIETMNPGWAERTQAATRGRLLEEGTREVDTMGRPLNLDVGNLTDQYRLRGQRTMARGPRLYDDYENGHYGPVPMPTEEQIMQTSEGDLFRTNTVGGYRKKRVKRNTKRKVQRNTKRKVKRNTKRNTKRK